MATPKLTNQAGFTLIELLIATTFFSFILIMISAGFIQINRMYQSAVITKNAQHNSRAIFEQLSRDAKDGDKLFGELSGASGCFGVGDVRYYFDEPLRTLRRAKSQDCGVAQTDGQLVHDSTMKVYEVLVTPVSAVTGGSTRSLRVSITLGVADESLLRANRKSCRVTGPTAALRLCSVAEFVGTISLRGNE